LDHGDWTTAGGGAAAMRMAAGRLLATPAGEDADGPAVRRALAGDAGAFEEIVRRHERRVYGLARRLLGRPEDAEDAAQEAFLRLFRSLGRLDPARPIGPYLYRVTLNVCRDLGRRRHRRLAVPLEEVTASDEPAGGGADPAAAAGLAEERRIAAAALRTLPERQRAALVLRDLQGLTTREVAAVLGTTEVTVRTQICRARLKVREFRDRVLGGRKERKS
jgi:RNA polymerase sigma-70 factor (ECF subfamily)